MKFFLGLSSQYSTGDVFQHTFAMGNEYHLSELRAFLAAHYGSTYDHVAIYNNGRTALNVAIKTLVKSGGKVVVTSLTCYAVVQAIKAAGCVPIFADVDPKTLHFGGKELEVAIAGETNVQAIIVQNNLGIPADIESIEKVANAHKLTIIEDLAHCTGVKYADGREVGTVGRAIALSFGKGKSIDTITGGAVVFTNQMEGPVKQPDLPPTFKENFQARTYPLFSLIIRSLYYIHPKLGKGLTAVLLKIQAIKRSADGVVDTKKRLSYWQCRLALRSLQALPHRGRKPLRDFYLVDNREELLKKLDEAGFYFRDIWYDLPVAPKRYFKKADFHPENCPVAAKLAEQIVNLPTWYDSAELKPARAIIVDYLVSSNEDQKDELAKDVAVLTETEKKAQIKAKKDAHAKKRKAEQKAERKAKKDRQKQLLKEDGAPDEEIETEGRLNLAKNAKEKMQAVVARVPQAVKKVAKKNDKDSTKTSASKSNSSNRKDNLDAKEPMLEQNSDLLSAFQQKEQVKTAKPEEEQVKTAKLEEEQVKTAKLEEKQTEIVKPEEKQPEKPQPSPVMRQAPRKLTEREKLKLELESGKKEGPSVI